ncbi:hypothetical protein HZH68_010109 [Vespula germanica]|uniref:Uncharacterized protein n=2 Tax=Vespula TaxID=7451 RepID=A0A834JZU9_VESGE|nr:hypothetical protein HZH68_010109 [Vespula germanica]KAF7419831.1 hypothetical protein H0235_010128 [Vespula pensylvanica]
MRSKKRRRDFPEASQTPVPLLSSQLRARSFYRSQERRNQEVLMRLETLTLASDVHSNFLKPYLAPVKIQDITSDKSKSAKRS